MKSPEDVILLGGIGSKPAEREQLPQRWQDWFELHVIREKVAWTGADPEEEFGRIGELITQLGYVSLVADSAAASMALNFLAEYPDNIHRVAAINGKINHPEWVGDDLRKKFPVFAASLDKLHGGNIDKLTRPMRRRVVCSRSLTEDVLDDPNDALLAGSPAVIFPVHNHAPGIAHAYADPLGSRILADFIRRPVVSSQQD